MSEQHPSAPPADRPTRSRRLLWGSLSTVAGLAVVAAAFVVVPRVTGNAPEAQAATFSWEGGCHNDLTQGTTTRNPARKGFTLSCDAMEVYVGNSGPYTGPPVNGSENLGFQAQCTLVRIEPLFISDEDLVGVKDVYWEFDRGWFTQGGQQAATPEGSTTPESIRLGAGRIIGLPDGGVSEPKFSHQYGTDVSFKPGKTVPCQGPNP